LSKNIETNQPPPPLIDPNSLKTTPEVGKQCGTTTSDLDFFYKICE